VLSSLNLISTSYFGLWYAQFLQNEAQRAKVGKPGLEQVEANKRGKCQRPLAHKQRAAFNAQGQDSMMNMPAKTKM
jgi:hypothetical protein